MFKIGSFYIMISRREGTREKLNFHKYEWSTFFLIAIHWPDEIIVVLEMIMHHE